MYSAKECLAAALDITCWGYCAPLALDSVHAARQPDRGVSRGFPLGSVAAASATSAISSQVKRHNAIARHVGAELLVEPAPNVVLYGHMGASFHSMSTIICELAAAWEGYEAAPAGSVQSQTRRDSSAVTSPPQMRGLDHSAASATVREAWLNIIFVVTELLKTELKTDGRQAVRPPDEAGLCAWAEGVEEAAPPESQAQFLLGTLVGHMATGRTLMALAAAGSETRLLGEALEAGSEMERWALGVESIYDGGGAGVGPVNKRVWTSYAMCLRFRNFVDAAKALCDAYEAYCQGPPKQPLLVMENIGTLRQLLVRRRLACAGAEDFEHSAMDALMNIGRCGAGGLAPEWWTVQAMRVWLTCWDNPQQADPRRPAAVAPPVPGRMLALLTALITDLEVADSHWFNLVGAEETLKDNQRNPVDLALPTGEGEDNNDWLQGLKSNCITHAKLLGDVFAKIETQDAYSALAFGPFPAKERELIRRKAVTVWSALVTHGREFVAGLPKVITRFERWESEHALGVRDNKTAKAIVGITTAVAVHGGAGGDAPATAFAFALMAAEQGGGTVTCFPAATL